MTENILQNEFQLGITAYSEDNMFNVFEKRVKEKNSILSLEPTFVN